MMAPTDPNFGGKWSCEGVSSKLTAMQIITVQLFTAMVQSVPDKMYAFDSIMDSALRLARKVIFECKKDE